MFRHPSTVDIFAVFGPEQFWFRSRQSFDQYSFWNKTIREDSARNFSFNLL